MAVSVPYWAHSAAFCLTVDGSARLRLPTHPQHPPHPPPARPPPINFIRDITAFEKNRLKNQPLQLAGRIGHKLIAIYK